VTGDGLVPGVSIERDRECTLRDGTVLRADVYRPVDQSVDLPVLLLRIPYNKAVAQSIVYHHPSWYARQGYVVVVQDTRGRFASDGHFDPLRTEAEDGFDAVEWAAGLPGSTGRVGTYGFSYAGATQLLAATQQPSALACCAPGFTSSDYYADWTYEGGALNLAFIVSWTVQLLAIPDAIRRGRPDVAERIARRAADFPALYGERPLGRFPLLDGEDVAPFFFDWLEHDTRDQYWQQISLEHRFDAIDVPCLHFGGWFDTFAVGTVRNFAELAERSRQKGVPDAHRLVMGPWVHMPWGPVVGSSSFGDEAKNRLNEEQLAWFDRWLKDRPVEEPSAPARLFVMGANRWRDAAAWPPPDSAVQEWFVHSDAPANSLSGEGVLSRETPGPEAPDVYVFDPANPAPSAGGRSCCDVSVTPMGVACQRGVEVRNDVLLYTSAALEEAVEVTGNVQLKLHAATSAVDTDWVARLVDVDVEGNAVNVCQGILRARFRDGLASPSLVEPGQVYEYDVPLGPTSWEFAAGHRIRLQITSGDYPAHDVNPNTGQRVAEVGLLDGIPATQVVHHDGTRPTRLLLPVAGASQ
jgi:putative CocE/NonD family hydrolase